MWTGGSRLDDGGASKPSTRCLETTPGRLFLTALLTMALPIASIARAADLPGAEVLEKGRGVATFAVGFDLPQTPAYSLGLHYVPVDRLQIGAELSTLIIANALSLTSRYALNRSPEGRFRMSIQGSVRGVYVPEVDRNDPDDWLSPSWDQVALLVLEPRVAAEWQPVADSRWRVFTEFGSQHYYGTADGDLLLNGGDRDHQNWGTALRASAGFSVRLRGPLAIHAQGGIWGSPREPLPVAKIALTQRFGGSR